MYVSLCSKALKVEVNTYVYNQGGQMSLRKIAQM
jgi:hypothetical protein